MGRYSDAFKAKAKALALKSTRSYESIAKELGVNSSTFRNWMNEDPPTFFDKSKDTNTNCNNHDHVDLNELKKELVAQEKEIKFLRKILAYITKNQNKGI